MIQVKAPDGTLVQFPDGTSREVMRAAMQKRFGGPEAVAKEGYWDQTKAAFGAVANDFRQSVTPNSLKAGQDLPGHLAGLLAAPVTDMVNNAVINPAAAALGAITPDLYADQTLKGALAGQRPVKLDATGKRDKLRQVVSTALMGLGGGGLRRLPVAAPRPGAAAVPAADIRVGQALQRVMARDPATPAAVAERARAAPGVPAFHAGGDNLSSLAEVVAQSPGPGQAIIRKGVSEHQAKATTRVKQATAKALGGQGNYFETLDATLAKRKAAANPLRDKAFRAQIDPEAFNAEVGPLMQRVPQKALSYAAEIAKRDGFDPVQIGFEVSPASGDIPTVVQIKTPTMQALHYVKKGMDQELAGHRNALGKLDLEGDPMAAATNAVRSDFGRALRRINPDYDAFMRSWGDESGQVEALRLGRGVFSSQPEMGAERLRGRFAEMSDAEKDLYRKGVGEAVIDLVRRKGGVPEARALLKNEEFADRVKVAVPDEMSFNEFMGSLEREVEMANRSNRVVGGSPTYLRQAARADVEGQPTDPMDMLASALDVGFSPARLTGKALKEALKAMPRQDRSIIGDPAMNEALARALNDPDEMTRLLNLLEVAKARRGAPAIPDLSGVRGDRSGLVPGAVGALSQGTDR